MSSPIKLFEIHLEHDIDEQYQYEPGELLRGEVLLTTTEEIKVKGIAVQIKGEATVSWDDETSTTGGQFSASETYVDTTLEILGQDKIVTTVPRGSHSYPVEFTLPHSLPSSFIGKFGSITYVVKATLREDRRLGLGTTITSEPFLVLRQLDITKGGPNGDLLTKKTATISHRSTSSFCFCMFGKVEGHFTIGKTGHLPGEEIVIDAEIKNGGSHAIKSVQASLVLNSSFHARNKTREHSQIVNKKSDNSEIEYDGVRKWTAVRLAVPPYIPESRLDGCDMIDIDYELQFRLEMEKGPEIRINLPIVIGTPMDERRTHERRAWNPDNYTVDGNGAGDKIVGGQIDADMELNMHEEMMDKFRHPIAQGETRQNILFNAINGDD